MSLLRRLSAYVERVRHSDEGQGLAEYALILALIAIVAIIALLFLSITATIVAASTNTVAVIPLPEKIELGDGVFLLTPATKISPL